jgi:hypothetical protein
VIELGGEGDPGADDGVSTPTLSNDEREPFLVKVNDAASIYQDVRRELLEIRELLRHEV